MERTGKISRRSKAMVERFPSEDLQSLLNRLETKANGEVARMVYEGRALSQSKDHLHLAVDTGILAIPIRCIENVRPLSERTPEIVRVEVSQADEVKHLLEVRPPLPYVPNPTPGIILRPPEVIESKPSEAESARIRIGIDTATITGRGVPDATDDAIVIVIACW